MLHTYCTSNQEQTVALTHILEYYCKDAQPSNMLWLLQEAPNSRCKSREIHFCMQSSKFTFVRLNRLALVTRYMR